MARESLRVAVNPGVLKWARQSAGSSIEQVAKRVKTTIQSVGEWESGARPPTLRVLENLAIFYRRPLAALLLPNPPKESTPPNDFRALPVQKRRPLSRATRLALRESRRLQARAAELLREMGAERAARIGTVGLKGDPEVVAATERERLGVTVEEQTNWPSAFVAFRRWREAIEALNILVFQMQMPVEEARAFSLSEGEPPVITLSASDAIQARVFSLFHEYAHLLLKTGGICIPDERWVAQRGRPEEERFCNHFAGALLVPALALQRNITQTASPADDVGRLARVFCVSRQVVWRRMQMIGVISLQTYRSKMDEWQHEPTPRKGQRRFGESAPKRCLRERGAAFADLVLEARDRDVISCSDAVDYLGIRVRHLDAVDSLLRGRK